MTSMQQTYEAIKVALAQWQQEDRDQKYLAMVDLLDREQRMEKDSSNPDREGCLVMLGIAIELMLGPDRISGLIQQATPGQYAGMAPR